MKRTSIVLVALAVTFGLALQAGAVPDGFCDDHPNHPQCDGGGDPPTTPTGGVTCEVADPPDMYLSAENSDFGFSVTAATSDACVDVSEVTPGEWFVHFDVAQGTIRELLVLVRDSFAPGDLCAGVRYRANSPFETPMVLHVNASDYVNACGTEFAEVVDEVTWTVADAGVASPLALLVFIRGSKDLQAEFWVDYPDPVSDGSALPPWLR